MKFDEHPTVLRYRETVSPNPIQDTGPMSNAWLRQLALKAGADDVGCISLDRAELDNQRADILQVFPQAKTLLAFVCRMNRENIRSPARSVANLEFHHAGDEVNDIAGRIVKQLERQGIRVINPAMGFPMEADRWPNKMWVVSHKPVAVAVGLGRIGLHRNVIYPVFGNFIFAGFQAPWFPSSRLGTSSPHRKALLYSRSDWLPSRSLGTRVTKHRLAMLPPTPTANRRP